MSTYIISQDNYLAHHGVKGMKWGVRRFQSYDGSYTKKGLENFNNASAKYDQANKNYKSNKIKYKTGQVSKGDLKRSKIEKNYAKKIMSKNYDQLKQDKLGDKGKELYMKGKTITGNDAYRNAAATIATGSATVAGILASYGQTKLAAATGAIGIGAEALTAVLAGKNALQARKLRAYYGHSRPNFEKSLSKETSSRNIKLNKASKYDNVYKNRK